MKKNLLVTLADKNYINQAKAAFASVYFNAGWKGDYLLLAHDILEEDLQWFRDKGILIKNCQPLYSKEVGGMPPVLTSKFYLFTPEFQKWENIIYIDADSIVKASLNELTQVKGFAAVRDIGNNRLSSQIVDNSKIPKDYNLRAPIFCAGFFVFHTDIIKEDTFNQLNEMFGQYEKISCFGDQLTFNLFFYNNWKKLPAVYNVYWTGDRNQWFIKPKKIKGIVLHFITSEKPWLTKNYFYKEWKNNLDKAENINLKNIQPGNQWPKEKILNYSSYLNKRRILFYPLLVIDRYIGLAGIFLKRNFPKLYFSLKKILNKEE